MDRQGGEKIQTLLHFGRPLLLYVKTDQAGYDGPCCPVANDRHVSSQIADMVDFGAKAVKNWDCGDVVTEM